MGRVIEPFEKANYVTGHKRKIHGDNLKTKPALKKEALDQMHHHHITAQPASNCSNSAWLSQVLTRSCTVNI